VGKERVKDQMSIIELSVLGRKLGVDVDAIRAKHMAALFEELLAEVRAAEALNNLGQSKQRSR